ncbi:MAG: phosphoglucosamine mutase [Candidatus Thermoplasmatota archaeon]|nr:phosphoglucosamine mutase [Candidatus Thermoplasmatota archaeon]
MLFGTSGIRGLANQDITPQLALQVGRACGALYGSVAVGRDPRTTSHLLHRAAVSGVLSTGAEVTDVGLVSTPTLSQAAGRHGAGIMVTASHNPPRYNGLKLFNPDGSGFSLRQSAQVEDHFAAPLAPWHAVGRCRRYEAAVDDHLDAIRDALPPSPSPLTVVVDCANGATGAITPYLLEQMGCRVIALNAQPDGFFPAHDPEPTPENLAQLRAVVTAARAHLGIAHDCDGDRMVAVDDRGRVIPGDALLAVLARQVDARTVVVPVNASLLIDDALPQARVERTRVGDIFVSQRLKENGGDVGGEPSGTYVFPSFSYCPDGVYAAALAVQVAAQRNLAAEIDGLPRYHTLRGSLPAARETLEAGMREVTENLAGWEHTALHTMDGVRVDSHRGWVLVRPSGTEPRVRVTVEARRREEAEALWENVMSMVKRCFA